MCIYDNKSKSAISNGFHTKLAPDVIIVAAGKLLGEVTQMRM